MLIWRLPAIVYLCCIYVSTYIRGQRRQWLLPLCLDCKDESMFKNMPMAGRPWVTQMWQRCMTFIELYKALRLENWHGFHSCRLTNVSSAFFQVWSQGKVASGLYVLYDPIGFSLWLHPCEPMWVHWTDGLLSDQWYLDLQGHLQSNMLFLSWKQIGLCLEELWQEFIQSVHMTNMCKS